MAFNEIPAEVTGDEFTNRLSSAITDVIAEWSWRTRCTSDNFELYVARALGEQVMFFCENKVSAVQEIEEVIKKSTSGEENG